MPSVGSSKILTELAIGALLLAVLLAMFGCGKVPPFPETWQCAFSYANQKFYCVNTKTKEKRRIPIDSVEMKMAQCVSLDDYKAGETWVQAVKAIAERKCR